MCKLTAKYKKWTKMILKMSKEWEWFYNLILQQKLIQAWITYFFSPSSKRNGSNDSGAFIFDYNTERIRIVRWIILDLCAGSCAFSTMNTSCMFFCLSRKCSSSQLSYDEIFPWCIKAGTSRQFWRTRNSPCTNTEVLRLNSSLFSLLASSFFFL